MLLSAKPLVRFAVFALVMAIIAGYVYFNHPAHRRGPDGDGQGSRDTEVNVEGSGSNGAGVTAAGYGGGAAAGANNSATLGGSAAGGGTVATGLDFFIDFRIDRDRARSHQLDLLREIIENPKADEAAKRAASGKWLEIVDQIGKETELEGLIRAKGFDDAVVMLRPTGAVVVVKVKDLSQVEAARIADVVARGTGLKLESIQVVAKP